MAGFEPKELKKNKIEIDLEDDDDIYIETDIDEDDEPQPSKTKTIGNPNSNNKKSPNLVRDINKKPKKEDKTTMIIAVGIVSVLIIVSIIFISSKLSKGKKAEVIEDPVISNNVSDDEKTKPGVPNLNGMGAEKNDDKLYDPSLITKDLNGNVVDANYSVINNEELTDFISYKKFRSPMGNGVEFYWLEAEYKGQPYKVQVPYSIYSKLDREGITVVDIELLTLENGSKMVTYMKVRKDAKSLLDKNR